MHQRHDIAPFGPKGGKAQYGNSQKGGENGKGERDKRGHRGNKVDPVVEKSSSSEVSDYYLIICQY